MLLKVNNVDVTPDKGNILTSGMVNAVEVEFRFSADWDGLIKTAVFTAGKVTKTVALTDDRCYIPWECLAEPNVELKIGVCGIGLEGQMVMPTVYYNAGNIRPGAKTDADPSLALSLPVWAEILASIGDLSQLETEARDSLVAAINEAARTGGSGSTASGNDGREIELKRDDDYILWRYAGDEEWNNLIAITDITGPRGADGKDGVPGSNGNDGKDGTAGAKGDTGEPGYTPVKGVDYFTESDITEIAAVVLASIPVDSSLAERLAGI